MQGDEPADPALADAQAAYVAAVQQYEAEQQQQHRLPPEAQAQLRGAIERCFDAACTALEARHAALAETERENSRVLNSRCGGGALEQGRADKAAKFCCAALARPLAWLCCAEVSGRRKQERCTEMQGQRCKGRGLQGQPPCWQGCSVLQRSFCCALRSAAVRRRGDLPEDMAAAYEAQRRAFEGLQRNAAALAEAIDRRLPELSEAVTRLAAAAGSSGATGAQEEAVQQVGEAGRAAAWGCGLPRCGAWPCCVAAACCCGCGWEHEGPASPQAVPAQYPHKLVSRAHCLSAAPILLCVLPRCFLPRCFLPRCFLPQPEQVFEDEEARSFYESLPDIRAVVPAVLLGEGAKGGKGAGEEGGEPGTSSSDPAAAAAEGEGAGGGKAAAVEGDAAEQIQAVLAALHPKSGSPTDDAAGVGEAAEAAAEGGGEGREGGDAAGEGAKEAGQLEALFSRLRSCVSKDLADELAVNFCYMQVRRRAGGKGGRAGGRGARVKAGLLRGKGLVHGACEGVFMRMGVRMRYGASKVVLMAGSGSSAASACP